MLIALRVLISGTRDYFYRLRSVRYDYDTNSQLLGSEISIEVVCALEEEVAGSDPSANGRSSRLYAMTVQFGRLLTVSNTCTVFVLKVCTN